MFSNFVQDHSFFFNLMLFVVRNSFSLYVLSMDASIYANEIFT